MNNSGILTDSDILAEIKAGRLLKGGDEAYVQTCSYDLRVGTIFEGEHIIQQAPTGGKQVVISPGEIISLFTLEELLLPGDITATAFAMNALSSQGILVLNPGHVDPGYEGPLTVRVINLRATPKVIPLGMPIFTVVFQRLPKNVSQLYSGNKPRQLSELEFHATDIEQNPKTLFNLITFGPQKPMMTEQDVRSVIMQHWMSKAMTVGSLIAALFAVIATFVGLILAFKPAGGNAPPPVNSTSANTAPSLATPSSAVTVPSNVITPAPAKQPISSPSLPTAPPSATTPAPAKP